MPKDRKVSQVCCHCGEEFLITRYVGFSRGRFPAWCDKPACQKAKHDRRKRQMKRYNDSIKAEGRDRRDNKGSAKFSEESSYTCIDCGKRIMHYYDVDEYLGKIYRFANRFRCKVCDYNFNRYEKVAPGWEDVSCFADDVSEAVREYILKMLGRGEALEYDTAQVFVKGCILAKALKKDLGEELYYKIIPPYKQEIRRMGLPNPGDADYYLDDEQQGEIDYFGEG